MHADHKLFQVAKITLKTLNYFQKTFVYILQQSYSTIFLQMMQCETLLQEPDNVRGVFKTLTSQFPNRFDKNFKFVD